MNPEKAIVLGGSHLHKGKIHADRQKRITIVSPCYNEEENISHCYDIVKQIFDNELPHYDYEHIFADNASTDKTKSILRDLAAHDSRVKVIFNSRNFGPFRSTFNALLRSSGDAVLVMLPVDLQDPPELIPTFVEQWEQGYHIVAGRRRSREEGFVFRTLRRIFYQIVSRLASFEIPEDVGEFQLIDKIVVSKLREFDDYNPYIRGMIASVGFDATIIDYVHQARKYGRSKYNVFRYLGEALNGILSFSHIPMRIAIVLGFLIASVSIAYSGYVLFAKLFLGYIVAQPGIVTLLVANSFLFGVVLIFLGILGEYISAIHTQVRKRPWVVERELINFECTEINR